MSTCFGIRKNKTSKQTQHRNHLHPNTAFILVCLPVRFGREPACPSTNLRRNRTEQHHRDPQKKTKLRWVGFLSHVTSYEILSKRNKSQPVFGLVRHFPYLIYLLINRIAVIHWLLFDDTVMAIISTLQQLCTVL